MPPIVIAGAIAAAGAIGGAVISSHGASQAAKTQQQSNDASIGLQRDVYNQNQAALAPWQQSGLQANSLLMGALGMGGSQAASLPTQQPATPAYAGAWGGASPYGPKSLQGYQNDSGVFPTIDAQQPVSGQGGVAHGMQPQLSPQDAASNAFHTFLDSTNYKFQLGQGMNAVNSGYAGAGTLQSGAAMKAINDYAQNTAQGAYQGWIGNIGDVANRGFGAASAQAGVGQNYANSVSNLNSANANALANLQVAKANSIGSAIGGIGAIGANILGNVTSQAPTNNYGLVQSNGFAGYHF